MSESQRSRTGEVGRQWWIACAGWMAMLWMLWPTPAFGQANPQALVERAIHLQQQNASRERQLAYRERVTNHEHDSAWNPRRSKNKVHDVLWIEGTPQRMLLEEDGVAQSAPMIAASQDFLRRVAEVRKAETERERRERVDTALRKQQEYLDAVAEIPKAFTFTLAGEEAVDGRVCVKLQARPRKGYQPRSRYGRIFAHTAGVIWIDKASGQWRRAEGEVQETVNLGWIFLQIQKGAKASVEQQEFAGQGWQMSSMWYRAAARVGLFVHYRREFQGEYWNYQPMTETLLARVMGAGYPGGELRPRGRQSQ
ncbi:MAG: hypothetical protein MUF01_16700 [Bryobacterales bacterium]|nr:hypothetical protein [Bryobacterales bacterium]